MFSDHDTIVQLLSHNPSIAIVGASNKRQKFGNIIFRDLTAKNFRVFPVNTCCPLIEGKIAFPTLTDLIEHHQPDLLVYVIPPQQTRLSLAEASRLGLKTVWLQPGSSNDEVREYLRKNRFLFIDGDCIMVKTQNQLYL